MAGRGGVRIQVLSEFDPKGFEQARKSAEGFSGQMRELAKTVGAAFVTREVVNFAKSAVSAASDLGESINAVNVTFGEASAGILALGENAATAVGLSQREFNAFAVQFSGFTQQIAGAGGDIVSVTDDLTTRIADFASVMNMDVPEAAQVFQSALAGETEPIRRFGYDMSAAAVEAHALATGLVSSKSEMTEAIKVQARYSLLMQSTNKVADDFKNTSGSLANQQRILTAEMDDAKATIGQAFIPALEGIMNVVIPLVEAFSALPEGMQQVIAVAAIATVGFASLSKSIQGLGVAASTANKTLGAIGLVLGAAATIYTLYTGKKAQAVQTTNDFIAALRLEGEEQRKAIEALALSDDAVGDSIKGLEALNLTTRDLVEYVEDGTGALTKYVDAVEEHAYQNGNAQQKQGMFNNVLGEAHGLTEEQIKFVQTLAGETSRLRKKHEDEIDTLKATNIVMHETNVAYSHYAESLQVTQESLQRVKDAIDEVNEARQAEQDALYGTIAGLVQAGEAAGYSTEQTRELVAALGYLDGLSVEAQIELGLVSDVEQALITIDAMILTIQAGVRAMGGDARDVVASTRELVELRNELRRVANAPATGGGGGGFGGGFTPDIDTVENEFDMFVEQVVSYGNRVLSDDFAEALFAGSAESIADTFDSVMMELAALAEGTVDASFDRLIDQLSHKFRDMVELANLREELQAQLEGIREVQRAAEGLFTTGLELQGADGLSLYEQMTQRVQQARGFVQNIRKLEGMGFPSSIIADVVNAGLVDGAAMAAELARFTPSQVRTFTSQMRELQQLRGEAGEIVGGLLGAPQVQEALSATDTAMRDLTEAIQTDLANGINTFLSGLGAEVDRLTNPTANQYIVTPNQFVREGVNVTVNAGVGTDGVAVGRQIVQILNEYSASGGARLVSDLVGG
jgi:hypothetical protein